jgi:AcrR family transcriptional regulator
MHQQAREKILSAALTLFSEKGYTAVSTRDIADSAGVNEVSIFRIFGKKRNLYLEVFTSFRMKPDSSLFLENINYELSHDLKEIGSAFVRLFLCNTKIVSMSIRAVESDFHEISDELKQQVLDISDIVKTYFNEIISRKVIIYGEAHSLAVMFTDMLFGYSLQMLKKGKLECLEEQINIMCGIFARGIMR